MKILVEMLLPLLSAIFYFIFDNDNIVKFVGIIIFVSAFILWLKFGYKVNESLQNLSYIGIVIIVIWWGISYYVNDDSKESHSYWNHNGSVMRLEAKDNQRIFYYEKPTQHIQETGVVSGDILFDGTRKDNQYYGTIRKFSKYCPAPLIYEVTGVISENETKITLIGEYESRSKTCHSTGEIKTEKLIFTYMHSE